MKATSELTKAVQGVKVVPPEPQEFLVQRQLKTWLEPGWCITAPAGIESNIYQKRGLMFWRFAVILMLLWLLGLAISYPMGGLIHVSLVVAIVIVLIWFIQGRRPSLIKADQARGPTHSGAVADFADPDDLCRFEGEGGAQAHEPAMSLITASPASSFHGENSRFVNSHEQPGRHEQHVSA